MKTSLFLRRLSVLAAAFAITATLPSCEIEQDDNNMSQPYNPTHGSLSAAVEMNFGNGEETPLADYAEWEDLRDVYGEINITFRHEGRVIAMACLRPGGTTQFPQDWAENDFLFFEYYSSDWESVKNDIYDHWNDISYGDWQVDNGTVTITSITETHLSGRANLVMYNLHDLLVKGDNSPEMKSLTITFDDIPLSTSSNIRPATASVHKAVATPRNGMAFRAEIE